MTQPLPVSTTSPAPGISPAAEEAAAAERQAQLVRTVAVVVGLVVLVVLGLVLRSRARRRQERRETVDIGDLDMTTAVDDVDEFAAIGPGGGEGALEAAPVRPEIQPPSPRFSSVDQRRAEVDALAAADPDKTAEYLRVLLAEDRAAVRR